MPIVVIVELAKGQMLVIQTAIDYECFGEVERVPAQADESSAPVFRLPVMCVVSAEGGSLGGWGLATPLAEMVGACWMRDPAHHQKPVPALHLMPVPPAYYHSPVPAHYHSPGSTLLQSPVPASHQTPVRTYDRSPAPAEHQTPVQATHQTPVRT